MRLCTIVRSDIIVNGNNWKNLHTYYTKFLQATKSSTVPLIDENFEEGIRAYATQLRDRTHSDAQIDISGITPDDVTLDGKFTDHFREDMSLPSKKLIIHEFLIHIFTWERIIIVECIEFNFYRKALKVLRLEAYKAIGSGSRQT